MAGPGLGLAGLGKHKKAQESTIKAQEKHKKPQESTRTETAETDRERERDIQRQQRQTDRERQTDRDNRDRQSERGRQRQRQRQQRQRHIRNTLQKLVQQKRKRCDTDSNHAPLTQRLIQKLDRKVLKPQLNPRLSVPRAQILNHYTTPSNTLHIIIFILIIKIHKKLTVCII